jgi:hypothetical protein
VAAEPFNWKDPDQWEEIPADEAFEIIRSLRTSLTFLCCFCGEDASDHTAYGITDENGQAWWCHKECFIEALHPEAREGPLVGEGE